MLERLAFIAYLLGIIPSGGLLSAGLIERQKRHEQRRALYRRAFRRSSLDYDGYVTGKVNGKLDPADRTITPSEREVSMVVGYLAGMVWPALVVFSIYVGVVGAAGFVVWHAGRVIGHAAMAFGRKVLEPTTRKFEIKIEQRTLEPKPQLEARPLGTLEKLKS